MTRKDELFVRIPKYKVILMREAKKCGYSLSEISKEFHVSKSTASTYCRDLFYHPGRMYETEEEIREAVRLRGAGKIHVIYHPCVDCGKVIRNESTRCLKCDAEYRRATGELEVFASRGAKYRFQYKGSVGMRMPKSVSYSRRKHNYALIYNIHLRTGYGAWRIGKSLGIPIGSVSAILSKLRREEALI